MKTAGHVVAKPMASLLLHEINKEAQFPDWFGRNDLARFLHENMKPYEDSVDDILRALRYSLSSQEGMGGFILVATDQNLLVGSVVILNTGMSGYISEHVLVFVGVRPEMRGRGVGGWLVSEALQRCSGEVKLHVEYDNPAKRLYERIGFTSKYAEMRFSQGSLR
jgi:ribosomal protein S18 acetylase RimI-like enzyme